MKTNAKTAFIIGAGSAVAVCFLVVRMIFTEPSSKNLKLVPIEPVREGEVQSSDEEIGTGWSTAKMIG